MMEKPYTAQIGKIRFAARHAKQHLPRGCPPLLALTDPKRTPDPVKLAAALPTGSGLIYRLFKASDRVEMAKAIMKAAKPRRLIVLIGNDPALALKVGADGVHWPERNVLQARRWAGRFAFMTAAAHSRAALALAARSGVDAVLLSAVFASSSPSAGPAMGALKFRQLARKARRPVYALGGLNSLTMGKISQSGGIAAIDGLDPFLQRVSEN